MFKKITALFIAVVMLFSMMTFPAFAETDYDVEAKFGYCKRNGSEIEAMVTFPHLEKTCLMYAALYNGAGIMRQVKYYDLLKGSGDITITFSEPSVSSTDYIKLFFLDKSKLVKPLGKSLYMDFSTAALSGVIMGTSKYEFAGMTNEPGYVFFRIDDVFENEFWNGKIYDNDDNLLPVMGRVYEFKLGEGIYAGDLFGLGCDVTVRENSKGIWEIVDISLDEYTTVTQIDLEDIDNVTDSYIEYYESPAATRTTRLKLDYNYVAYYNYSQEESITYILTENGVNIIEGVELDIEFIDNTGDSKYDIIIVKEYTYDRVCEVREDGNTEFETVWAGNFEFDFEDEDVDISISDIDGNPMDFSQIKKNDVIAYISDNGRTRGYNWIELIVLGESAVVGMVEQVNRGVVYINGTKYIDLTYSLNLGDEGIFYLTKSGKIFDFEKPYVAPNYAVVLQTARDSSGFEETYQVKLLTKNDGIVIYNFRELLVDSAEQDFADFEVAGNIDDIKSTIADRLIVYTLDSNNEIRDYEFVTPYTLGRDGFDAREYDADSESIGNLTVENTAVVFGFDVSTVEDAFSADSASLIDGNYYSGYYVPNDYDNAECIIILQGELENNITEDEPEVPENTSGRAIVLDAVESYEGFYDAYQVKLLTEYGEIVIYNLRESLLDTDVHNMLRSLETNGGGIEDIRRNITERIITYKLDSKNNIREVEFLDAKSLGLGAEYDADAVVLGNTIVSSDVVIFDVDVSSIDSVYATDISYLRDKKEYEGVYVNNDDGKAGCIIITTGCCPIDFSQDLAIVVEVTHISINEGADEALKVKYNVSEEAEVKEIIVARDPDVTELIDTGYYDISVGDVVTFFDDGKGQAPAFAIVADYEEGVYVANQSVVDLIENDAKTDIFVEVDYIKDWTRIAAGTKFTSDSSSFVVKDDANTYTWEQRGSRFAVNVGSWDAGDVDRMEGGYANYYVLRKDKNIVCDFFVASKRVEIPMAI